MQVFLVDKSGNSLFRDGKIVGVDPSSDLAVLKVHIKQKKNRNIKKSHLLVNNLFIVVFAGRC